MFNYPIKGPEFVQMGIADLCNYKCIFCFEHSSLFKKEDFIKEGRTRIRSHSIMKFDLFKELIDDLSILGVSYIDFVGRGEPFVNPDIHRMIYYAKGKKIYSNITTNGVLINKSDIRKIIENEVKSLIISFDAGKQETYKILHPNAEDNAFERIINNFILLAEEKKKLQTQYPFTILSIVLNKYNYRELSEIAKVAIKAQVNNVMFVPVGIYEPTKDLALTKEQERELIDALEQCDTILSNAGIHSNKDFYLIWPDRNTAPVFKKIPCYIGYIFSQILADGTVEFCCACTVTLGNIKEKGFSQIWRSQKYKDMRRLAQRIPKIGRPLDNCHCFKCGFAPKAVEIYNRIHPYSRKAFKDFFNEYRNC